MFYRMHGYITGAYPIPDLWSATGSCLTNKTRSGLTAVSAGRRFISRSNA